MCRIMLFVSGGIAWKEQEGPELILGIKCYNHPPPPKNKSVKIYVYFVCIFLKPPTLLPL